MIKRKIPIRTHSGEFRKSNKSNKKYLARDFENRCAYCDDLDSISGGYKSYHVEHFAPKEKFPKLEFQYENLLYSCPYCNCSKNDDWPSNDSCINVIDNSGYIDPCTEEYYKHLDRNEETGEIIFRTELGKYMYRNLQLYLRRHAIIYMLDKLKAKCDELQESIKREQEKGKNTAEEESVLNSIKDDFFKYYSEYLVEQST